MHEALLEGRLREPCIQLSSLALLNAPPPPLPATQATPMASNHTLLVLGAEGRHREVRLLVDLMQRHALANEHTYGAAISALDQAGRFDMALQYFEELYR